MIKSRSLLHYSYTGLLHHEGGCSIFHISNQKFISRYAISDLTVVKCFINENKIKVILKNEIRFSKYRLTHYFQFI